MDRQIEFADLLSIVSLYLAIRNLSENEAQPDAQIKILRQNDVGAVNDRQTSYLLEELGRGFNEQNQMLKEFLEAAKK